MKIKNEINILLLKRYLTDDQYNDLLTLPFLTERSKTFKTAIHMLTYMDIPAVTGFSTKRKKEIWTHDVQIFFKNLRVETERSNISLRGGANGERLEFTEFQKEIFRGYILLDGQPL